MAKNDTAASRPARAPPADDASNRPTDGTSSTATGAATAAGTAGDGVDGRGGGIDKATAVEDDEEFDPTFNPWAAEAEDVLDPDDDGAMVVETTPVQPASKRTKTKRTACLRPVIPDNERRREAFVARRRTAGEAVEEEARSGRKEGDRVDRLDARFRECVGALRII